MHHFPLYMDIRERKVVVVGGGKVAYRKVNKLLATGAHITVVSPSLCAPLFELYSNHFIQWIQAKCQENHLRDAFLIISASGSKEAQEMIKNTTQKFQLVNGADNPSIGNVIFPAVFEEGDVSVAISTGGSSPTRAKKLKNLLKELFKKVKDN
ncbi:bifunctional precorrin-2 dehydrogenase/sirohydrochlorin ferrochelatase [Aliibacillus thermotolerans]|uniref:precorrin-2 dehydrogenase n=1 Tax=Aliibacillus thermotolerans TaxID=1834418 RepID=A0ABW0U7C9_9BACI|nr:NAD(P)-dependent oxidoreductase [Aliibacillus thermotolerans]